MSQTGAEPPKSKTSSGPPRWVRALGRALSGILILAALVLAWFIYKAYYANPRTDDAYVHANTASVAAHVSGQIIRLPINDNQRVKKGDILFVVDPRPYKLALNAARTKLNLTEIEVKTQQDTINSAAAQLTELKVDAANAKQYLDRIVPLREHDFVTDNDVVEARNKLTAAQAGVEAAASELRKAKRCAGNPRRCESARARGRRGDRGRATELRLLLGTCAVRGVRHEPEHLRGAIRQCRAARFNSRG